MQSGMDLSSLPNRRFQKLKQREQNWEGLQKKTYMKETKLGGSAKNKEQREGVR